MSGQTPKNISSKQPESGSSRAGLVYKQSLILGIATWF
jgi:hypothetical protein